MQKIALYLLAGFYFVSIYILATSNLLGQEIHIAGEFTNCDEDSLMLYGIDGTQLKPLVSIPLSNNSGTSSFELSFDNLPMGMYVIGNNPPQNPRPLLVSEGTHMKLTGDCKDIKSSTIWQSDLNQDWQTIQKRVGQLQTESRKLTQAYYQADSLLKDSLSASIDQNDQRQLALLDSLKETEPLLAHLVAPYIFISYINNGTSFEDEIDYFAQQYFQYTQLSHPVYNRTPTLFQAFKSYAYTLGPQDFALEDITKYVDNWLNQITQPSPAHSAALLGLIEGFQSRNTEAFAHYAERFVEVYEKRNPEFARKLQYQMASAKAQMKGAQAPEIALPSPKGDTIRLSDFRGKVVLIDFWASWCRPCRVENPNVVRLYQKYKDQGFEILGVSLDRNKQSWIKAIEQDQLSWSHVSDLNYFQNEAAQIYGVNAIPYTVLVDTEGKIIATRLRGKQLENKLEDLFGS